MSDTEKYIPADPIARQRVEEHLRELGRLCRNLYDASTDKASDAEFEAAFNEWWTYAEKMEMLYGKS